MARLYTINTKRYDFVDIDSSVITSYIVGESDHNKWLKIDTTTSSVNLQLPDGLSDGLRFVVENTGDTTINYQNGVGTSIATQQDLFTEDKFRTVECVFNAPTNEWRIQGFVGRNDISSLYDVNTNATGVPSIGDVLQYNGSVWTTGKLPPFTPNSLITVDKILDDQDHGQILPVETSALPVDIAINTGLDAGFYCRIINVGTGTVTLTPAVTFNSPVVSLTNQYDYVDIWHAGLEQYYAVTNNADGGGGGGSDYLVVNSTGSFPTGNGVNSVVIGPNSFTNSGADGAVSIGNSCGIASLGLGGVCIGSNADVAGAHGIAIGLNAGAGTDGVAIGDNAHADVNGVAIGNGAEVTAFDGVQLGAGVNSTADTLQFGSSIIAHNTFGIRANSGSSNPIGAGLAAGTIFLNTTTTQLNYYNGTTWAPASANPYILYNAATFGLTPSDAGGSSNLLIGGSTVASADQHQIVIGADAEGTSEGDIVIGVSAEAIGDFSISLGHTAATNGSQAIAIGRNSDSSANDSVAIGGSAVVSGSGINAVQLGAGTNATANTVQYLTAPIAGANGVIIKTTSGAPVTPAEIGTANFDPGTNILYIYNGTSWVSTTLT